MHENLNHHTSDEANLDMERWVNNRLHSEECSDVDRDPSKKWLGTRPSRMTYSARALDEQIVNTRLVQSETAGPVVTSTCNSKSCVLSNLCKARWTQLILVRNLFQTHIPFDRFR
jgi:hypothetical protein